MNYNVIATGSSGNAVVLNENILIDCGVSLKALSNVKKQINVVLLTHIHQDHFNKTTIKQLAKERPILRFACCEWLVSSLLACGVSERNIDVLKVGKVYNYGAFKVSPVKLYHDVDQCGWRVYVGDKKAIYMTDTGTLDGISAKCYDLYLVEANYIEEEIQAKIKAKQESGQYIHEYRVLKTHLSKEQCDEWLLENMGENSEYVYLHQHQER
jgi:L-ascorbate metabolism protein UlaG (beta-lactamase superfamily)